MADPRGAEIAKLEALFSQNPDGRVFTHLAEAYRRAGELERARALLEAGLERHADYASAHVVHGRVLLDLGLEAEAEAAFRRVLGLDPENLVALRALGDLARRAGRAAEALGYYEQLQLRDPSSEELEAIIGELKAMLAPAPAEAGDWAPAAADAGAAEGAEPGFGGAADALEIAAHAAEEPAGAGAEEPAAFESPEPAEVEQPGASEAQEWAMEGRADEGTDASFVESSAFSGPLEPLGPGEAPPAEAEAAGEGETGPEEAEPLVAGVAMDEVEASGAGEAGFEEPAAAFEAALPEGSSAEPLADPEAIVTWHVTPSDDVGAPSPEGDFAEPDAGGGEGAAAEIEAEIAAPALDHAVMALDGLADVEASDAVLPAEPADTPAGFALDEEFDLEIGSLANLPDATHSLLFKDEYTDPESETLPLEAWTPLTDEQIGDTAAAGDGDAGPGDLEAGAGVMDVGPGDLEVGQPDWEAEGGELEAAELTEEAEGGEPEAAGLAEEAQAPVEAADAPLAMGSDVAAPVVVEEATPGEALAAEAEAPVAAPEAEAPVAAPEAGATASAPEAEAIAPEDEALAPASEAAAPAAEAIAPAGGNMAASAPAEPRGEAVEGPDSLGGEVVTETLADLYLSQGLFDRAAALYRRLLESQPGDARLEARLREAEERLAGATQHAETGGPGWEVVGSAVDQLGAGQRVEDVEAVWTGGAGAGGQDVSPYAWPEEGEPGSSAEVGGPTIGQYLDALLQWKPSRAEAPAEAAPPAEPKAGAGGGAEAAGGKPASDSDDDDDLEMFRAWLQSLKR